MSPTAEGAMLLHRSTRLQQEKFFHDRLYTLRFRAEFTFRVAAGHTEHSR
jgi:hypothetical protein